MFNSHSLFTKWPNPISDSQTFSSLYDMDAPLNTGIAVYVRFRPLSASELSPTSSLRGPQNERCVRVLARELFQSDDGGDGSSPRSCSSAASACSFKSRRRPGVLRDVRFLGGDGATDEAQYRFAYDAIMDEDSTQVKHAGCAAGPCCVVRRHCSMQGATHHA
jgi:hypothetical protein